MKKTVLIFLVTFLLTFLSFYPPFSRLIKVETDHFIIYYEKEVEHLIDKDYMQFMEDSYKFLSNLFNHGFKNKIYVYFSNREKIANGFNNPIGQSTIYIITTPPELHSSIGYMDDWLKLVFYHELTHQFSLSLKGKLAEFLSYIFGNIFLTSYFNNPFFMIEGVTTSFEGRELEIGRVYSPYIKQFLMQQIIDNNFKNPYELENSYEKWPYRSMGYWYGGFFSKFLQETYGMTFYIDLWKKTAIKGFEPALKEIYGKELLELWDEFYNWLKPKFDIYISFEDCLKNSRKDILSNGRMAKIKDEYFYFYYNANLKTIFRYSIKTRKIDPVIKDILYFYSFEIDEIRNRIILSYYDYKSSSIVIKHKIYDIEKKRFIKSNLDSFTDIREVNFFNQDFIAIDLSRSFTDLTLIEADGTKRLLIKGNKNFYISSPKQLDGKTILFLASLNGERSLYSFDIFENKVSKLNLNAKYIYNFNIYDGKIYFTYNNDYTLSKFGLLDENKKLEVLFEKNFSGGFTDPYYIEGKIFYIGSFSDKSLLLSIELNLDSPQDVKNLKIKDNNIDFVNVYNYQKEKNDIFSVSNAFIDFDKLANSNSYKLEKGNEENDERLNIKKSYSIFPLNENLLPDFWMPSFSFYYSQFKSNYNFYYTGFGAAVLWLEPVTNSSSYFGTYISSIDPFLLSFDFNMYLNYFYPFTFNIMAASYWLNDLIIENEPLSYLFLFGFDLYYQSFSPIAKSKSLLNLGCFYRNKGSEKFISAYLGFNYYKYIFGSLEFPFYIKNLIYISNMNFDSNIFAKYELETSFSLNFLNIEIKDNIAISKENNLTAFAINKYFHTSLYEPIYESYIKDPELKYGFSNILNIKATIFETSKMGILNILFPSSSFNLGLYLGYKFYLTSSINYNFLSIENLFSNILNDHFLYFTISLFSVGQVIKFNFTASYSLKDEKFYYYFYYILQNPYNLISQL